MAIEERIIRHVRCDLCGLLGPASEDGEERAYGLAVDAGFTCEWLRDWCSECVEAGVHHGKDGGHPAFTHVSYLKSHFGLTAPVTMF